MLTLDILVLVGYFRVPTAPGVAGGAALRTPTAAASGVAVVARAMGLAVVSSVAALSFTTTPEVARPLRRAARAPFERAGVALAPGMAAVDAAIG